ncbi:MAG TPA: flavin reductase family protein [Oscillospiraceae bacterium]|nr:flavin reductase family protein [Oscillospiraceae bacterium]
MKKSFGAKILMYPCPVVAVGTYDQADKPNLMAVAWSGVVNGNPASVSIAVRKATYTYGNLLHKQAFTLNFPSRKYLQEFDFTGKSSGRNTDKFAATGLTPVHSDLIDAPLVEEFPVVLECKLIKHVELGLHTLFIGEIVDAKVDAECLTDQVPDTRKIDPLAYIPGDTTYYTLGEALARPVHDKKS